MIGLNWADVSSLPKRLGASLWMASFLYGTDKNIAILDFLLMRIYETEQSNTSAMSSL